MKLLAEIAGALADELPPALDGAAAGLLEPEDVVLLEELLQPAMASAPAATAAAAKVNLRGAPAVAWIILNHLRVCGSGTRE